LCSAPTEAKHRIGAARNCLYRSPNVWLFALATVNVVSFVFEKHGIEYLAQRFVAVGRSSERLMIYNFN
jgi:hypothetical protein